MASWSAWKKIERTNTIVKEGKGENLGVKGNQVGKGKRGGTV